MLHEPTWKIVNIKNQKGKLFQLKYFKPVEYWKYSDNAVTSPDYECQGRIAIYRVGPRYVSILYRCIDISSDPYITGTVAYWSMIVTLQE